MERLDPEEEEAVTFLDEVWEVPDMGVAVEEETRGNAAAAVAVVDISGITNADTTGWVGGIIPLCSSVDCIGADCSSSTMGIDEEMTCNSIAVSTCTSESDALRLDLAGPGESVLLEAAGMLRHEAS